MRSAFLAIAALPFLAACAQGPDSIAPVSMVGAFDALPCEQVPAMLTAELSGLAALEASQRNAQTGDALGVFLIGVPVSSLSGGDVAGQIAASKGKVQALQARAIACGIQIIQG